MRAQRYLKRRQGSLEGLRLGDVPDLEEGLESLEPFTFSESIKTLPMIRRRHSKLNQARRRYILGDDSALDET